MTLQEKIQSLKAELRQDSITPVRLGEILEKLQHIQQTLLSDKQAASDISLQTQAKDIAGAINELKKRQDLLDVDMTNLQLKINNNQTQTAEQIDEALALALCGL